jgi:hypothetical protein
VRQLDETNVTTLVTEATLAPSMHNAQQAGLLRRLRRVPRVPSHPLARVRTAAKRAQASAGQMSRNVSISAPIEVRRSARSS